MKIRVYSVNTRGVVKAVREIEVPDEKAKGLNPRRLLDLAVQLAKKPKPRNDDILEAPGGRLYRLTALLGLEELPESARLSPEDVDAKLRRCPRCFCVLPPSNVHKGAWCSSCVLEGTAPFTERANHRRSDGDAGNGDDPSYGLSLRRSEGG